MNIEFCCIPMFHGLASEIYKLSIEYDKETEMFYVHVVMMDNKILLCCPDCGHEVVFSFKEI